MIRPSLLLFITILAACSAPSDRTTPSSTTTMAEDLSTKLLIDGLIGKWISEQGDDSTIFHEQWHRVDAGHLQGIGFVMLRNDTVSIEHLNIHVTDSGTFYAAQIPSQNDGEAVSFKLQADSESLVFVNDLHDFPQRIVYAPARPIGWTATVSGTVEGELRSMQFHLRPRE